MKRFQLLVLAASIAGVSPVAFVVSVMPAQAKQCGTERPPNARSYWSYRLIDGRKCWYEGKPMLSKSMLHWLPARTAQADPAPELNVLPPNSYTPLHAPPPLHPHSPAFATPCR